MMQSERIDRLSALVSRFELGITVDAEHGNLAIYAGQENGDCERVIFMPHSQRARSEFPEGQRVFFAATTWQGFENPLLTALPPTIELSLADDEELKALVRVLVAESRQARCGSATVLAKLGEVLLIRIFRQQIEEGETQVGMLGGLADPRLSRAIVAMHNNPGRLWNNQLLAEEAGLSLSRFADRFSARVGQPPMSYLRHWRMLLARQDIERGDRIQSVADRYGYASSEAMARAFRKSFGVSPRQVRDSD